MGPADEDERSAEDVADVFERWAKALCASITKSIKPVEDWDLIYARNHMCDLAVENLQMVAGAQTRIISDLSWSLPARNPIHYGEYPPEWGFAGSAAQFRDDVRRSFPSGVSPRARSILEVAVRSFSGLFDSGLTVDMIAAMSSDEWAELYREILRQTRSIDRGEDKRSEAVSLVTLCEHTVRWLVVARFSSARPGDTDLSVWPAAVARHWGEIAGSRSGDAGDDGSLYWTGDSLPSLVDEVSRAQRR